jgi:protease-4
MRGFLKQTLATVLGLFIFSGVSFGGLLLLLIAISSVSRDGAPEVKDKSVLVFDLSQTINDAKPRSSTSEAINDALSGNEADSLTLRSVVDAIDAAAKDQRIVGLYLSGGSGASGTGYATLREVRKALERFKQSGKKVFAYDTGWQEREYYLASLADTIALNPIGQMEINGLSSEGLFFADALQRFGIGVQVTRVGKYKSAVEPFLQNSRSPADREQTQKLLSDLWSELLGPISKSRNLTPQQLQTIADSAGFLNAKDAKERKLVDRIAYEDEVLADLKQLTGEDRETKSFRRVSLKNYVTVAEEDKPKRNGKHRVAVVYAEGAIVDGQGGGQAIGGDRMARQLRELRLDDDVKAVVLRVNSPGGSATASDVIQREVILMKQAKKPIIISMGNVAASGGYWIATYGDRIFAEPNTITGSIGVFGRLLNVQRLANQNGITWDVVKTGRFADTQTASRPKTPEELQLIQRTVDDIYDQFLTKVAQSRNLDKKKVADIAQGRVWSGTEAKAIGLVDELGGLEEAVSDAAKRANLGDNWRIEEYPKTRTLEEQIFGRLLGAMVQVQGKTPADPITQEVKRVQDEFSLLRMMNDPRDVYLMLPFDLRID